jgi:hypothetical protein
MSIADTMPLLPIGNTLWDRPGFVFFTAADMREYAEAYAAAKVLTEREACARVCDAHAIERWALYKGRPPYTSRGSDYEQGESNGADHCADAIRARGE